VPPPQLVKAARDVASYLREKARENALFQVVSHLDADGIAAASIISTSLTRLNARFHVRIIQQLSRKSLERIPRRERVFVFTDMGSGQLKLLEESLQEDTVVIDHHPPEEGGGRLIHFNPHLFGLDGGVDVSGAGAAYLVAREIDVKNRDLSPLAIVGALGDRQDKGKQRSLTGLNAEIAREGVEHGILQEVKDLIVFGRETRPIPVALEYTTDPFIPGLSGNHGACLKFLVERVQIPLKAGDRWRTIAELSREEKARLVSELVKYMLGPGNMSADEAQSIIGTVYVLSREREGTPMRDAREYASLLNACGRTGRTGLGLAICMGERKRSLSEAAEAVDEYRVKLADYINWVEGEGMKKRKNLYWFSGVGRIDVRMVGTVASILASSKKYQSKVIVGLAYSNEEDCIKASIRLGKGGENVDLGELVRRVMERMKLETAAGGHELAAGAYIPVGKEEEFLMLLDEELGMGGCGGR